MEQPRFTWDYRDDLDAWNYEVRDGEEAIVVARCETKEDAKRVHHALVVAECGAGSFITPAEMRKRLKLTPPDSDT